LPLGPRGNSPLRELLYAALAQPNLQIAEVLVARAPIEMTHAGRPRFRGVERRPFGQRTNAATYELGVSGLPETAQIAN